MKQFEAKERSLDGNTFYIRPFPAFKSANISGELFSLILPMFGALAPMASSVASTDNVLDMDIDFDKAAPMLTRGLASLSGDKVENLFRLLLVKHKNISVILEDKEKAIPLTEDLVNEIFCGNTQDMYILAVDVIRVNYSGFFERLGNQFGGQLSVFRSLIQKKMPGSTNTDD